MKFSGRGKSISKVEVQDITRNGIWILLEDKEYFLAYNEFPWFRHAPIADVFKVQLLHRNHLHWPDLDVDLEVESLRNPRNYPLLYSSREFP